MLKLIAIVERTLNVLQTANCPIHLQKTLCDVEIELVGNQGYPVFNKPADTTSC